MVRQWIVYWRTHAQFHSSYIWYSYIHTCTLKIKPVDLYIVQMAIYIHIHIYIYIYMSVPKYNELSSWPA